MRFNGNILGVDNRASVGNTRGLWTLPPQAQARRRGAWSVFDQDAATYIAAVEAQDQQPLELEIKDAIHTFVAGCKTDGIWSDIQSCAILCGARTLSGALRALVGTNPTNNNFVSGDYSRALGLNCDTTQWLDTNRNNNADGQDDQHAAGFITRALTGNQVVLGVGGTGAGALNILNGLTRSRNTTSDTFSINSTGLIGISRDNASTYDRIAGSEQTSTATRASQTPFNGNVLIFRRDAGQSGGTPRIAFYSVGGALSLTLLEKNVSRLMGAIQGVCL